MTVEGSLDVGRCGCSGYTRDPSAFGTSLPVVDVVPVRLRVAGQMKDPSPSSRPPVRDLFDEERRLRDLSEFDGVPWRPPQ
jgi:hypothetical protein